MRIHLPKLVGGILLLCLGSCVNPTTHLPILSITLGVSNDEQGIHLDQGGDVDTLPISPMGDPADETRTSGNGVALAAPDNSTPDFYLQFNVDDTQFPARGVPTSHVRVEVDYFDSGLDSFSLQYDAFSTEFASGGSVVKMNTNSFKTARFNLCDANFVNRVNGGDFRISDNGDGAEFIRAVRVIGLTSSAPQTILVDEFGANPFDNGPDSDAIQAALDSSCSGDTIVFKSGVSDPAYEGYLINKTLFLTGTSPKHDLRFTSSDPNDHALLQATRELKGYVVRLYARSRFTDAGLIDNIDFGNINVNGGRDLRKCSGSNNISDGFDDNWGSWLPQECSEASDPWCAPGNIAMDGGIDWNDVTQDYPGNPDTWSTGIVVHDVLDRQAECGSALTFSGAAGTIQNVMIDTAGDHVHAETCALTDNDGDREGWSDGITFVGPNHMVQNNTIINASDVGIVFFGGMDTIISNNMVKTNQGNYGMFTGIAVHPWILGDVSGTEVRGNQVESLGDQNCGGMHVGINLGPHMWGGACQPERSTLAEYGNNGSSCSTNPNPMVESCTGGPCQVWAYLPADSTFTMKDNVVTGAHINYLVEGFAMRGQPGQFIDLNNISRAPQLSDWHAARSGCNGVTWGALDKVAHDPSLLPTYTELIIHCER